MGDIPKVIHYVWFGRGNKSDLIEKCIKSWRKFMPNYEIIEWNEDNFIIDNQYAQEAYDAKMYAFVSDYVRLQVIYTYGGIYLDTDVEIIKPLDPLLKKGGFIGFERKNTVTTGLGFAAPAGSEVVRKMLEVYDGIRFNTEQGFDTTPCPVRNSKKLEELGLLLNNQEQKIGDIVVYPQKYFCPLDYDTGKLIITNQTYTIHHYGYSWSDENSRKVLKRKRIIFNIFPKFCSQQIFNIVNHIFNYIGR